MSQGVWEFVRPELNEASKQPEREIRPAGGGREDSLETWRASNAVRTRPPCC